MVTLGLLDIALGAAGVSAAVSILIVLSERWHGKHTLDHDLAGVQKFHTTAVPRIGGVAIVTSILVLVFGSSLSPVPLLSQQHIVSVGLLVVASLPVFLAGIIEDLTKKVSVRVRLIGAIVSALAASWLLGATVDKLDIWGVDALLASPPVALGITALVVSGGVNAINIIDGFNGLAGSTVAVMLAALGAVGFQAGDTFVVELAVLGLSAAVGFLLVNYPTGRIFLGDGGAYFLGFWVAEVAVLLLVRNPEVNAWQILAICAYPVIEVLYSIYRRKVVRQASPGSPDGLHLHTLVYRRVVSRFFPFVLDSPWKRNAAVACVMVPWIAAAALLSVMGCRGTVSGMLLVVAQVVVYIAVYARIVRGRWSARIPGEMVAGRT